ncbi:MAG TPA: rhodanese-like domain-containing protein [Nitrospiria bacterium]
MDHKPGFLKLVRQAKKNIKESSVFKVKKKLERGERFYFIDVREDHEFQNRSAKGALHLGRGIIERDIEELVPDKKCEIILYCGGGYRSALAALNLKKMGYQKVFSMAGGIKAWLKADYPIQTEKRIPVGNKKVR